MLRGMVETLTWLSPFPAHTGVVAIPWGVLIPAAAIPHVGLLPHVWLVLAAAIAGAAAGRFGRGLLRRLPHGVLVAPGACELGVAVLWSAVAVRVVDGLPLWWSIVPLVLGWLAVLLTACDVLHRRLPDALTLPVYPFVALIVVVASLWANDPTLLLRALGGAVVFAGVYSLVRLLRPSAMGAGDVKLAGGLGAAVGAVSVFATMLCVLAAAVLTLITAGCTRARTVAHGPAMLAPAWFATTWVSTGLPGLLAGTPVPGPT